MSMSFVSMRDLLIKHFEEMTKDTEHLFVVQCDKDEMWQTAENIARRFYQIDAFGTTEKTARFRLPFAVGLCYNHWAWTRE